MPMPGSDHCPPCPVLVLNLSWNVHWQYNHWFIDILDIGNTSTWSLFNDQAICLNNFFHISCPHSCLIWILLNDLCWQKCSLCSRFHCARCLLTSTPETASPAARWAAKNLGISRRTCVKCAMLSTGDYTREDLLQRYSARELRNFLVGKHIVIDGCKEKEDLVDLAMRISGAPSRAYDNDHEHSAHVAQMKVSSISRF